MIEQLQELLADNGLYAEDLVKENREDSLELLSTVFKRTVDLNGSSVFEGSEGTVYVDNMDIYNYLLHIESEEHDVGYYKLSLIIPLENIQRDLDKFGLGLWEDMDIDSKRVLLEEYGIDYNEGYIERTMLYRADNNRVASGKVIIGQERLDKDWLRSGRASHEAKIFM